MNCFSLLLILFDLDDGVVKGPNEEHGEEEVEDVGEQDKCPLIDPGGEEVIGACQQETLGHVVPPASEGGAADEDGVAPDDAEDAGRHAGTDLLTGEALHDDVVSVVTDDHHGHDGTRAKDGSKTAIQTTS